MNKDKVMTILNNTILEENNKICTSCEKLQNVANFERNTKTDDGYLKTCFACCRANKRPSRSLRKAINGKCKECIYDPHVGAGSWQKQVTDCTSGGCPLFDVRPTSIGHEYG